jgi:hypothetical protein
MRTAGSLLLVLSALLFGFSLVVPLAISFWTIASSEASARPSALGDSAMIPLVCLPGSALAAITGMVVLWVSLRRKRIR